MGKKNKKPTNKTIDLSGLPKFKFGDGERIRWENSVGCIIPFRFGEIDGNIRILEHRYVPATNGRQKSELLIVINEKTDCSMWLSTKSITHGKFYVFAVKDRQTIRKNAAGDWIDLSTLPAIYDGTHFGDIDWGNSDGLYVDFQYQNVSGKMLIGKYQKPKIEVFIEKYMKQPQFINTQSVLNCGLFNILSSRIIDVRPDLIEYLKNKDDAYYYNVYSSEKIDTVCPICGNERKISVLELSTYKFTCTECADGVSFPNKFLTQILKQAHVNFKRELNKSDDGFEWAEQYSYDFAFCVGDKKYIVEADGGQHKRAKQQKIDRKKTQLAEENGYMLIRIDCDYGHETSMRGDVLRQNIVSSQLNNIVDLSLVDWAECEVLATKNLVKEACALWETFDMGIQDIAKQLYIAKSTAKRYLQIGLRIGLCPTYNAYTARYRGKSDTWKPVGIFADEKLIDVNESVREAYTKYHGKFGMPNSYQGFNAVCRRQSKKQYDGFTISFITKEQYLQHKMINNNEVVLKEAI